MNAAAPVPPGPASVLLVGNDPFECAYVGNVLTARGIRILGPFADPDEALAAITVRSPDAAVIASTGDPAAGRRLCDTLARHGIPCLTLAQGRDPSVEPPGARLARPFAAFQVAEWVSTALATRGGDK